MAFDGFTLKAVVNELQSYLLNGKITKVYQPTPEEIILGVYANGSNYALSCNISFSLYSLHLTTMAKSNPLVAPNFCMLLRKHINNFKIKNIYTLGLERIAIIELEGYNELNDLVTLKLIIELMGKHSNIILVNQNNIIIDSLKHLNTFAGSYRNILPGSTYQYPELNKQDINNIFENFSNSNSSNMPQMDNDEVLLNFYNNSIGKENILSISAYFLEHFVGTSKPLLEYAISKLNITDDFCFENFKKLSLYLKELIDKIDLNKTDLISFENDYVLTLDTFSSNNLNLLDTSTLHINFFLDDFYSKKEQLEQFIKYRNSLLAFIMKRLKKISKKVDEVNNKIQECSKTEEYKLYGELLTSNLYRITDKHINSITLENYYNNEAITIPLDMSISPAENAKKYFKKYHKLKNTIDIVSLQKIELESEINYLESIVYELQVAKSIKDIDSVYNEMEENNLFARKTKYQKSTNEFKVRTKNSSFNRSAFKSKGNKNSKNASFEKNDFICYKIENFNIMVGKNNKQNDYLTMKLAKQNDIWFHVKDIQGSHVILIIDDKTPSQDVINKVASIAAYYSKARQSSNVPIDYTLAKYVKKPTNSKPGMVIYTNQRTVNVQPNLPIK